MPSFLPAENDRSFWTRFDERFNAPKQYSWAVLWKMASFSAPSTMEIFQAKSFVTGVIFVSLGSSSLVMERMMLSG